MKKIMAVALIVAALITMVIVPVSAKISSEDQAKYDNVNIYCPNDSSHILGAWGDLKGNCSEGTLSVFCSGCGDIVNVTVWACGYCQYELPEKPTNICPSCHAGTDCPVDANEYGEDAVRFWYQGSIYGYEKGKAAGSDGGYEAGYNAGYEAGRSEGAGSSSESGGSEGSDAYEAGLAAGRQQVLDELEATATTNKYYQAGVTAGYNNGYSAGYTAGEKAGYNKGYSAGYSAGYAANQAALKKAQQEAEAAKARYDSAYQDGVQAEVSKNFISLVGEIAAAPFHAVQNMFNFEIFGVNVASLLLAVFTLIIVVAITAFVLKTIF